MFNGMGQPVGAQITNYLLEKVSLFDSQFIGKNVERIQNRVVGQIDDERDFHIFYQFTKGASAEMKGQSYFAS